MKVPEEDVLPLKNSDVWMIDNVVSGLGIRHAEILRRRFGLYGRKRQTLRAIGERFEVGGERIRQLESRALSRLRHSSRIGYFRLLTQTGLEKMLCMKEVPLIGRRVEDFELSARTLNAVRSKHIGTLVELASKTEREMLKIRNFGRKGLLELKSLLQSLGLDFAH